MNKSMNKTVGSGRLMVLIINSLGRVIMRLKFGVSQKTNGVLSVRIQACVGVESESERESGVCATL